MRLATGHDSVLKHWRFVGVRSRLAELVVRCRVLLASCYDGFFFARAAIDFSPRKAMVSLRGLISTRYHTLEKGLTMPGRKTSFGLDVSSQLALSLADWTRRDFPGDDSQAVAAKEVLALHGRALRSGSSRSRDLEGAFEGVTGGYRVYDASSLKNGARGDFGQLARARRSIREFSAEPMRAETIVEAISLAQQSPSSCNRQSARVRWSLDREMIDRVLELQNGNRGFGHLATGLLIITSDARAYAGVGDRRQGAIDVGMFSMSLLYALHYLGAGACPLNWSTTPKADRALRKTGLIPDYEEVIMMIACGNIEGKLVIPLSARLGLQDVSHELGKS